MRAFSRRIDRRWRVQVHGLCVECRRVMGLLNAPESTDEDDEFELEFD
jgi:hypothetical protein